MKNPLPLLTAVMFLVASCTKTVIEAPAENPAPKTSVAEMSSTAGLSSSAVPALPGSISVPILAGQHIPVGTLTISNDAYLLYVTYEMTGDYRLKETHLYAGSLEGIPTAGNGNAVPGRFPYKTNHSPAVSSFTYTIPLSDLPTGCLAIAAHSVVVAQNSNGQITFSQTGWSQGPQVNPGGNWAMYTDYCPVSDIGID